MRAAPYGHTLTDISLYPGPASQSDGAHCGMPIRAAVRAGQRSLPDGNAADTGGCPRPRHCLLAPIRGRRRRSPNDGPQSGKAGGIELGRGAAPPGRRAGCPLSRPGTGDGGPQPRNGTCGRRRQLQPRERTRRWASWARVAAASRLLGATYSCWSGRPRATSVFEGRDLGSLTGRQLTELRRHMQIVFQDPIAALNPQAHRGPAHR